MMASDDPDLYDIVNPGAVLGDIDWEDRLKDIRCYSSPPPLPPQLPRTRQRLARSNAEEQ